MTARARILSFLCLALSAVSYAQNLEIDRVDVVGVQAITPAEIEALIEISPGDVFERSRVVRTIQNIKDDLYSRGYWNATVKSDLVQQRTRNETEVVLRLTVDQGLPTRVRDFVLVPVYRSDRNVSKYWEERESKIQAQIELKRGAVLDQEKVDQTRRAIQDVLFSDEFIGVQVHDAQYEEVPGDPGDVTKWIRVTVKVELGDRVRFGFRGNEVLSYSQLAAIVDEQRVIGLGKDYVEAIRVRIVNEYQSLGYLSAAVTPYTFESGDSQERKVTYAIEEGPITQLGTITFDGATAHSQEKLREVLLSRAPNLIQKGIYVANDFEKSVDLLIEWLKTQGYVSARLVSLSVKPVDDHGRKMNVGIFLYDGDRTFVRSVNAEGLNELSQKEIIDILGVPVGQPFNPFSLSEGIQTLKRVYASRGYLDFAITNEGTTDLARYSEDSRSVEILLKLTEGTRYRVSRIEIDGLSKTREYVVRRELVVNRGEYIAESATTDSEDHLRRLGVFSSVLLKYVTDPDDSQSKILRIVVQEGTPGVIGGGIGFRNDLGARVFGEVAYANLGGRNHTVSFLTAVNERFDNDFCANARPGQQATPNSCFLEGSVQIGYRWPWFLGLPEVTFRPRLNLERVQYRKFDSDSLSLVPTFEKVIFHKPKLAATLSYNLERIQQYNAQDPEDNGEYTIGSIIPALSLDMRDSPLLPSKGVYSTLSYEIASSAFGSQRKPVPVGFRKMQFRSDFHNPLPFGMLGYFSFRTGVEQNSEKPFAIPTSRQFVLGGAGSLRGFKEQELNTGDAQITGSLSYVNYRAQIDFPFAGALHFGPFFDAANLLIDRYSFGMLRYGTGAGFRYRSPVGPINFDWGFKLDPRVGEDTNQFYFSIGVI